jgi:tRNA G37 N-methylase Trm5
MNDVDGKEGTGDRVKVVFVDKKDAKTVKKQLVDDGLLNKDFRMIPASGSFATTQIVHSKKSKEFNEVHPSWIAIPVVEAMSSDELVLVRSIPLVAATGYHWCPYSTKVLGNGGRQKLVMNNCDKSEDTSSMGNDNLSLIQLVILNEESSKRISSSSDPFSTVVKLVRQLDATACPQRLERLGDDQTLVIPPLSFEGEEFTSLLRQVWTIQNQDVAADSDTVLKDFWRRLAHAHNSPRIVRRGGIDPNSKIRESGHRLVWPYEGVPDSTGPGTPGWICVTEQGIRQSCDMTRVMFSRGNVSEKIRFGKIVQEGEVVLDMYAGIGYYTLPAVLKGKASLVYACEWNEYAVKALKYNVLDNKVSEKVHVLVGDCRKVAEDHHLIDIADRVSLGLLPSSEGGWRTAVRALKKKSGGWIHVHGNVPVKEKESWALWVCARVSGLAKQEGKGDDWVAICTHIERVKSFAPTVNHYVADVFVGPRVMCRMGIDAGTIAGIQRPDSTFVACPTNIDPPSCALSKDGVLCQEWMR